MILINSVRVGKKGQIVIPEYIRKSLNLDENSILSIYLDSAEEKVILLPANKIGSLTRGMLKGIWGNTKKEIDNYIKRQRDTWNRNY
ncbi:MAG: AbrB/MazE/SpoVT family DNA-binding domain-containing protein [Actinobacteria bacterium]|nr:AbrB/MazE/SpoVT family DNA-binding domain-containing protein [Actinomycetota bacterium]